MDLSGYIGPAAFGVAYCRMLENDVHAPGSVDRVLTENMVRLCAETAEYLYSRFTPLEIRYQPGSRPKLERILEQIPYESFPASIAEFTSRLGTGAERSLSKMLFGGTEEEIVERGSDWCTDVARVACVLSQIAGFPARIVYLFNLEQAYSGHVIIEVYYHGKWGAVDSSTGVVYKHDDGTPASVWELMNNRELVANHGRDPRAAYTTPEQFQAAGIANYFCWEYENFDYTVSPLNAYYRSILEMSDKGWPGGLRWLHGEDSERA